MYRDRWFGYVFSAAMAFLTITPIFTFGPDVEGRLFPVVIKTKVTQVHKVPDNPDRSRVYGSSIRVRDECDFKAIEWYYGDPNGQSTAVFVDILEKAKLRKGGLFTFGPWIVHLSPDLIRKMSYAVAVHRCHAFWDTRTKFWP